MWQIFHDIHRTNGLPGAPTADNAGPKVLQPI
jgi:hypothetical protein